MCRASEAGALSGTGLRATIDFPRAATSAISACAKITPVFRIRPDAKIKRFLGRCWAPSWTLTFVAMSFMSFTSLALDRLISNGKPGMFSQIILLWCNNTLITKSINKEYCNIKANGSNIFFQLYIKDLANTLNYSVFFSTYI